MKRRACFQCKKTTDVFAGMFWFKNFARHLVAPAMKRGKVGIVVFDSTVRRTVSLNESRSESKIQNRSRILWCYRVVRAILIFGIIFYGTACGVISCGIRRSRKGCNLLTRGCEIAYLMSLNDSAWQVDNV
jgi:hypothetical protein